MSDTAYRLGVGFRGELGMMVIKVLELRRKNGKYNDGSFGDNRLL